MQMSIDRRTRQGNRNICSADGCNRPSLLRGFCSAHYTRLRVHGDIETGGPLKNLYGAAKSFMETASTHVGDDCLVWPFPDNGNGYPQGWYNGRKISAHRMVCILAHGEPPGQRMQAAHSCGNRMCVNPRHLRWATAKENIADKRVHGTQRCGAQSWNAKLTDEAVRQIRQMAGTTSCGEIGKKYGVSASTIQEVVARKTWRHVK